MGQVSALLVSVLMLNLGTYSSCHELERPYGTISTSPLIPALYTIPFPRSPFSPRETTEKEEREVRKVAPVLIRDMDALMRERTVFVIIKIRVRFFSKYKYVR